MFECLRSPSYAANFAICDIFNITFQSFKLQTKPPQWADTTHSRFTPKVWVVWCMSANNVLCVLLLWHIDKDYNIDDFSFDLFCLVSDIWRNWSRPLLRLNVWKVRNQKVTDHGYDWFILIVKAAVPVESTQDACSVHGWLLLTTTKINERIILGKLNLGFNAFHGTFLN